MITERAAEHFPREQRISKRSDFVRTYEQGSKLFGRFSVLFFAENPYGHPRLGITATRKVGKANIRNRLKRWVREVYRHRREQTGLSPLSIDLVVNLKPGAAEVSYADFDNDLTRLFGRARQSSLQGKS